MPGSRTREPVSRGWSGVQIQPVTSDLADSLGLRRRKAHWSAEPSQAKRSAAKEGIESGESSPRVNGAPVKDAAKCRPRRFCAGTFSVKIQCGFHKGQEKVFLVCVTLTLAGSCPIRWKAKADTDDNTDQQTRRRVRCSKPQA